MPYLNEHMLPVAHILLTNLHIQEMYVHSAVFAQSTSHIPAQVGLCVPHVYVYIVCV